MYRFGAALTFTLFLAIAARAQTLSEAMPLTTTEARTPSFRNTTGVAAAPARDGFVVAWKESSVVRVKRLSPQGDVVAEWAQETWDGLMCVGANGDETLVSLNRDGGNFEGVYVRIHADGHMTTVLAPSSDPGSYVSFVAQSLVPFGDGYAGTSRDQLLRLDLDGHVVAHHDISGRGTLGAAGRKLVAAKDRTLLLSLDGHALYASTIGPDFTISPAIILSDDLANGASFYATADPSGELAVATKTVTGFFAVLFFDSQLRSSGRVVLPAPSPYYVPTIASSGNGYVLVVPASDNVTIVTIDAQRRLATLAVVPYFQMKPVSGADGALIAFQTKTSPSNALFVIAGGSQPPLPPRLLADAEPDQRWPRIARLGDRVVIAWDESTGQQTALMAAIFDPSERRIVAGPVEIARGDVDVRGDELGVASDGRNIAIAWSSSGSGSLFLLSPDLQPIARQFEGRVHDVAWDGSAYIVAEGSVELAISRFDSTLKYLGGFRLEGVDAIGSTSDGWVDGRLLLGSTDMLFLAHNWYQLLCYCGEGPWHIAVQRLPRGDGRFGWQELATSNLYGVKRKMSGFARAGDRLLLFFPQRTEARDVDTLALLTTLPNDAMSNELPDASLGQAAVAGNQIVGAFGNVLEFFELDGTPLSTLPLDATANDSQFAAGTPFVIVNDAVASSGSRRINVRLLDLPLPHRRAAAH